MLEEDAVDFFPPRCHYIEERASCNMLDNIAKLIASVCGSLGIVQPDSSPSHLIPFEHKDLQKLAKHSSFMKVTGMKPVGLVSV